MDFEEEIRTFWESRLINFSQENLFRFQLSQRDQSLLVNVGLPDMGQDKLQFFSSINDMYLHICDEKDYLIIGRFGVHYFGIEIKTRKIYFIHNDCSIRDFLNSNLESLLLFLVLTDYKNTDYGHSTESEINSAVEELGKQLYNIDPDAFERSDSFWSVIIRDIRSGLV